MGVLIDTSILIEHERGRLDLDSRIRGREQEAVLSVVGISEMLHGAHRAADPRIRAKRLALVEGLLRRFQVLPIDLFVARVHAEMWAGLAAHGVVIGAHDRWLAATCLAHDHTIATTNVHDFRRVPGLSVEHWPPSTP